MVGVVAVVGSVGGVGWGMVPRKYPSQPCAFTAFMSVSLNGIQFDPSNFSSGDRRNSCGWDIVLLRVQVWGQVQFQDFQFSCIKSDQ